MHIFLVAFLLLFTSPSRAETWKVATLEWPPYVCSRCYKNGAAAHALREELKKKGITVEFVFYPWIKAQRVSAGRSFVGLFPAWKEEIPPGFSTSEALFESPIVIVENKKRPLKWSKISDLKGKKFGTTEGYGYTTEFNEMLARKEIQALSFINEDSSLRKLVDGQVDGIVMDMHVAQFFLNHYPLFHESLQISGKIIQYKRLFFGFNVTSGHRVNLLKSSQEYPLQLLIEEFLRKNP